MLVVYSFHLEWKRGLKYNTGFIEEASEKVCVTANSVPQFSHLYA